MGHLTRLNPQDAWLPITESRSGNAHYAGFHSLNAGLGFQALLLPVAFSLLGWFAPLPSPPSFHCTSFSILLLSPIIYMFTPQMLNLLTLKFKMQPIYYRSWGIVALTIAYFWQLYTLWILVKLHEAIPGRRYNRYVELAQAAFGKNLPCRFSFSNSYKLHLFQA